MAQKYMEELLKNSDPQLPVTIILNQQEQLASLNKKLNFFKEHPLSCISSF